MPLIDKSGKLIPLVRPTIPDKPISVPHRKIKVLSDYGLKKVNHSRRQTIFKVEKGRFPVYMPVFVAISFRQYAETSPHTLSDVCAEILMHYLDDQYPGWDANVEDRPVADFRNRETLRKNSDLNLRRQRGQLPGTFRRIKGDKVLMIFQIPLSIHFTIRSISKTKSHTLSDITTEAMMFFFDQTNPGWDLAADMPEEDDAPKTP